MNIYPCKYVKIPHPIENNLLTITYGRGAKYNVLEVTLQVLKFAFFLQMVGKYFKCQKCIERMLLLRDLILYHFPRDLYLPLCVRQLAPAFVCSIAGGDY